jgi:type VI secretion system protein ImpG
MRTVGNNPAHYRIYSVDRITESDLDAVEKITYTSKTPITLNPEGDHICQITQSKSLFGDGFDTFLSIPGQQNQARTAKLKLNIELTCTNGVLPDRLNIGDICIPTATTPEFTEFKNIKPVMSSINPESEPNRQWRIFSAFSLNRATLDDVNNFRAILRLIIHSHRRNHVAVMADMNKIDAIVSIDAKPVDRLIGRGMYRGYDVRLKLHGEYFAGLGDLYLYCSVLERFLGGYVTQNCFIRLVVEELGKGYLFEWPERFGDKYVL